MNPIEEAFSKVKNLIRKAKARTLEALFAATAEALGEVSEEDARAFFEDSGYRHTSGTSIMKTALAVGLSPKRPKRLTLPPHKRHDNRPRRRLPRTLREPADATPSTRWLKR